MTECQNDPPIEKIESGFELTATAVQKRCEGTARYIIPDGYGWVTAGADVGGRLIHWTVTAWKDEFVGHVIDYGTEQVNAPSGNLNAEENQKDLEEAIRLALLSWIDTLDGRYCYRSGEVKKLDCVAIDARYMTNAVYNAIKDSQSRRIIPVMGYGTTNKQAYRKPQQASERVRVGRGWHQSFHDYENIKVWQYHVDDDYYKFKVQQGFVIAADQPGAMTLFGDVPFDHKGFAKAIVSEKRCEEFKAGRGMVVEYVVKERNKNHWLDATKYSRVAAAICGVNEYKPSEVVKPVVRDRLRPASSKPNISIRTNY
jgi:phage terminase large subunit GpA-like protein